MNVALVYDRVNKWGGAERVLGALHHLYPEAPLYTAVYDKARTSWADQFAVKPSFLTNIPFAKSAHEAFPWFTPLAFETFSFDGYDAVISVTSAEAKDIITKPGTTHICYCLTPTRYLWSGSDSYRQNPGFGAFNLMARLGLTLLAPILRSWDLVGAQRPDAYIAISERVKKRIEKYYHRDVAAVVYPPVDAARFMRESKAYKTAKKNGYFLTVSRLVGYKRIDLLIEAFNKLKLPLVIIGDGYQKGELKRIAGPTITFVDRYLTDSELVRYYGECRAFVYAADEDFGIAAVEAQSCGKPVIAYRHSGVSETVSVGVTGLLFEKQHVTSVMDAVRKFQSARFDPEECRKNAMRFDTNVFERTMKGVIQTILKQQSL
jgi:glycosyltransferase involved in cell wall biosynthesis